MENLTYSKKIVSPTQSTFKGGWWSGQHVDENGKVVPIKLSDPYWQYMCCYGIFRLCKGGPNRKLNEPGTMWSLHINTYNPYCKLPNWIKKRSTDWHVAFIKRFPFVVFGFRTVDSLCVDWYEE